MLVSILVVFTKKKVIPSPFLNFDIFVFQENAISFVGVFYCTLIISFCAKVSIVYFLSKLLGYIVYIPHFHSSFCDSECYKMLLTAEQIRLMRELTHLGISLYLQSVQWCQIPSFLNVLI